MAERKIRCERCEGTGMTPDNKHCKPCNGTGEIVIKTVNGR